MRRRLVSTGVLVAATALAIGCGDDDPAPASATTGSTTGPGTGGSGGSGGGSGVCTPGETSPCYEGPDGTEGVGICAPGTRACLEDGVTWSDCADAVEPRVDDCGTPEDEDCDGTPRACATGDEPWSLSFGGASLDDISAIAVDVSGDVFLGARTFPPDSSSDFGSGPLVGSGFLVKLTSVGALSWVRALPQATARSFGLHDDGSITVAGLVDAGGTLDLGFGAIEAGAMPTIFLAGLDAAGEPTWTRGFTGAADPRLRGRATTADGGVVVVGEYNGTMDLGALKLTATDRAVLVALVDAGGDVAWAKSFQSTPAHEPRVGGVGVTASGNVVLAYTCGGTIDFGGGPVTTDGLDVCVVELDASGAHVATHVLGGPGAQRVDAFSMDPDGSVVLLGGFNGEVDFGGGLLAPVGEATYVARFDAAWTHVYSKSFAWIPPDDRVRLQQGPGGATFAYVSYVGTVDFGGAPLVSKGLNDLAIAKLDATGDEVWLRSFGDPSFQVIGRGAAVAVGPKGHAHVVGGFEGPFDFGQGVLEPIGHWDGFVAKLAP